jgi:hypothetical protein
VRRVQASHWAEAITRVLAGTGSSPAGTEQLATLVVASYRGLLLDLLVTGDRSRTEAALKQLADYVGLAASRTT